MVIYLTTLPSTVHVVYVCPLALKASKEFQGPYFLCSTVPPQTMDIDSRMFHMPRFSLMIISEKVGPNSTKSLKTTEPIMI